MPEIEKQSTLKKLVVPIAAVVVFLLIAVLGVSAYVNHLILESNTAIMRELSEHDKAAVNNAIDSRVKAASNLAASLSTQSILSIQELHEFLNASRAQIGAKRIMLLGSDGKFYSSDGTSKVNAGMAELATKNPEGFVDRTEPTSKKYNDGLLVVGAPMSGVTVQGIKFTYIVTETKLQDLSSELVITSYDGQGKSVVMDESGNYIVNDGDNLQRNAFETLLAAGSVKGMSVQQYIDAITSQSETVAEVTINGIEMLAVSSKTAEGWIMLTYCPMSVLSAQSNRITVLFAVMAVLVVIAVGTAIVLTLRNQSRKELEAYVTEVTQLNGELEERQAQLEELSSEQEAHINEITQLNGELEERQAQLEEAAAEQEAHIEEVTQLNGELEERQAQLEEAAAEQEAHVEEVTALNDELDLARREAEAANAAKTSFLFNMSHDIRTPMNAIMGFRDLLEKHQDDPEKRADYLAKIEGSSLVLLSIINNVLEMARIEKGTIEIDETAWSAERFNDTLFNVFSEMMRQKHIEFTREVNVTHRYVYCDPIKLREVFMNILSNACKYTNPGGKVHMRLEELPSEREGYALYRTTITDTGIGMSEEFLPRIFEEFSREANSTESKIEGTGLGMPIVKRLVELMEGTIEVKSEQGQGTVFVVTLPHKIADKAVLVEHAGVEVDPKLFEGKRILLAEDNDLNAEIAIEILGEAGFMVERAEDGSVAIDLLSKSPADHFDAVLMDIQMPFMNGYEATRAIRKMGDSAKANIPILAMTANAFEEDKREAVRAGMNGHLAEPVDVSELMQALASVLG